MTEPNLDKILRRIAYWNGYDSHDEWEKTGHEAKAQLEQYIANQVREARIDEVERFLVEPGEVIPYNNNTFAEGFRYVVDKLQARLKELGE